ncbi:MAG: hypothetical protein E6R07_15000 [Nevskiaceae bacterium]|nr:MAG: hypothetical protein E6R07_15000 [Nevskiaceae bacterium]
MKPQTKQLLLGPAVVGGLLGAFVGLAAFGFTLEYGPHTNPEWQPLWLYALGQAVLSGGAVLSGTVFLFGLLPLWVRMAWSR